MIFDAHAHIFTPAIIKNVSRKTELVGELHLNTAGAFERSDAGALMTAMEASDIEACLILPTAGANRIEATNRSFIEITGLSKNIYTAGTLHPEYANNREELEFLGKNGIKAIKLCSFSQGFALNSPRTIDMFNIISDYNINHKNKFIVVLDTFFTADRFFRAPAENITTPELLEDISRGFPDIVFIAAHMGGLDAPFREILYLFPKDNLYLDTSNAAHTLKNEEFIRLLKLHGPGHILFGTDWPWFYYDVETTLIRELLDKAGYSEEQKKAVFGGNITRLLGLNKNN